jgi:hypothetical protein
MGTLASNSLHVTAPAAWEGDGARHVTSQEWMPEGLRSYPLGAGELLLRDRWMRPNHVRLEAKLGFLRDFLDHVVAECEAEYENIMRRNEEGDFPEYGHLESATDYPFMRVAIAARAIYYEVNSLLESVLQGVAEDPWLESGKHRSGKTVRDLRFGQLVRLVEGAYGIALSDVEGWSELCEIREAVNSFKHREGFVHLRRQPPDEVRGALRHKVDVEQAYEALETARGFTKALWKVTTGL